MAKDKAKKITPVDPSTEVDDEKAESAHEEKRDAERRSGALRGKF